MRKRGQDKDVMKERPERTGEREMRNIENEEREKLLDTLNTQN